MLLLALVLAVVLAPWAPAASEAPAGLFEGAALSGGGPLAPGGALPAPSTLHSETEAGPHLIGTPVSIALDRTAAATG